MNPWLAVTSPRAVVAIGKPSATLNGV